MPYEDIGDAYMNHAGGGMYGTGPKVSTNRTNDKVTHGAKPSKDEIRRVSDWWFEKRDRLAQAFDVEPKDVPASAVWFLNLDYRLSEADIEHARRLAKELGLETS